MAYLNGLYAVILLGGGLMGYRRGSTTSLVASSVFAALYALAAYLINSGSYVPFAVSVAVFGDASCASIACRVDSVC